MQALEAAAKEVVVVAVERSLTLGTVESCTGGLVAHLITQVPGASQVFEAGWVCYSNAAKMHLLDVPRELLMEHGAVSEEVALALVQGARRRMGVDVAVSTTGIAGPTGATPGKPVGLMWCALAQDTRAHAQQILAQGLDRSATKRVFAMAALERLHEALDG
jgi:nicotinamide-nucleotide amidase